jgi:hypothetical protein
VEDLDVEGGICIIFFTIPPPATRQREYSQSVCTHMPCPRHLLLRPLVLSASALRPSTGAFTRD